MANIKSLSAKRRGKQANVLLAGGREESGRRGCKQLVSNRMCLIGATHNAWCNMASATVVGAWVHEPCAHVL